MGSELGMGKNQNVWKNHILKLILKNFLVILARNAVKVLNGMNGYKSQTF